MAAAAAAVAAIAGTGARGDRGGSGSLTGQLVRVGDEFVVPGGERIVPGRGEVGALGEGTWYLDRLDAEVRGGPGPPGWDEFLGATATRYGG